MELPNQHFNKDPRLTSKTGDGPLGQFEGKWEYNPSTDIAILKKQGFNIEVSVVPQNETNGNSHYRDFIQIPNLKTYFFKTEYNYDLITTREDIEESLSGQRNLNQIMNKLDQSHKLPWETVVLNDDFSFQKSLARIRYAALQLPRSESVEAISVLHNIAKAKKRISVVNAHGSVEYDHLGHPYLEVANNRGLSTAADNIAKDLANDFGAFLKKKYDLIYFTSCNLDEDNHVHAPINPTRIPVIVHTGIRFSESAVAPAMVYWP